MMTPTRPKAQTVYLIDASIYIFQAYFSPYTECNDSDHNDLSAVYGFIRFLLQFMNRTKPNHLAIARDESLFCGFRHQLCPQYKSNRELPDLNLESQLEGCARACDAMGLRHFASKQFEADDILGTLANRVSSSIGTDLQLGIVSRDKDLAQLLLKDQMFLWDYSGDKKRYRENIVDEYGILPEQFPDYLGLVGDSVDMISGVPGVGPVKAKALLNKFATMEEIYEDLEFISKMNFRGAKTLPALLAENADKAKLSKSLATIVCTVNNPAESFSTVELDDLKLGSPNLQLFTDLLRDLKFQASDSESLLYQFEKFAQKSKSYGT
ncbi:MAG: 5'-3' exonuclease H3TH domain-containing protein [Pseudohongiellaceae bacterium]